MVSGQVLADEAGLRESQYRGRNGNGGNVDQLCLMDPCFDEISSNKTERLQQHNTIQSSLESLAKEAISSSEPS